MPLRPGCSSQVVKFADRLEHGRQSNLTDRVTQADMWTPPEVDVGFEGTVKLDLFWFWEFDWVMGRGDLKS